MNQLSMTLMSRQLDEADKQVMYELLGKSAESAVTRQDLRQLKTLAGLIFASPSFQIR